MKTILLLLTALLLTISCKKSEEAPSEPDSQVSEPEIDNDSADDKEVSDEKKSTTTEETTTETTSPSPTQPAASGSLALDIDPSFPAGVSVTALSDNPDQGEFIEPASSGTIHINESTLSLSLAGEMNMCADLDMDAPMGTPPANDPGGMGGGGGGGQLQNDNMYLLCRQTMSYAEKYKEQAKLVAGEADDCFKRRWIQAITMQQANSCYTFAMSNNTGYTVPGDRLCTVAWTQDELAKISGLLESSLLLAGAGICQAKKDGNDTALNASGEIFDLKPHLSKAFVQAGESATVQVAQLKRLADENQRPTYRTKVDINGIDNSDDGGKRKFDNFSMTIVHSPGDADNPNFHGTLWVSFERGSGEYTNMNLLYKHSGDTKDNMNIQYEVRYIESLQGSYQITDLIDPEGFLNYENLFDSPMSDTLGSPLFTSASGFRYAAINLNPWTGEGGVSVFQNPGTTYNENAVGMTIETQVSSDTLSGCAAAGAMKNPSYSIRKALAESLPFVPTGRRCDSGVDGGMCAGGAPDDSKVWYQCFTQDASGEYIIDASKITDTTTGYDVIEGNTLTITAPSLSGITYFTQTVAE